MHAHIYTNMYIEIHIYIKKKLNPPPFLGAAAPPAPRFTFWTTYVVGVRAESVPTGLPTDDGSLEVKTPLSLRRHFGSSRTSSRACCRSAETEKQCSRITGDFGTVAAIDLMASLTEISGDLIGAPSRFGQAARVAWLATIDAAGIANLQRLGSDG